MANNAMVTRGAGAIRTATATRLRVSTAKLDMAKPEISLAMATEVTVAINKAPARKANKLATAADKESTDQPVEVTTHSVLNPLVSTMIAVADPLNLENAVQIMLIDSVDLKLVPEAHIPTTTDHVSDLQGPSSANNNLGEDLSDTVMGNVTKIYPPLDLIQ